MLRLGFELAQRGYRRYAAFLVDLTVEEPDIEDVLRRIYAEG